MAAPRRGRADAMTAVPGRGCALPGGPRQAGGMQHRGGGAGGGGGRGGGGGGEWWGIITPGNPPSFNQVFTPILGSVEMHT